MELEEDNLKNEVKIRVEYNHALAMLYTVTYGYFCVLVCRKIFWNGQSLFEASHGHKLNKQICINIVMFLHPAINYYQSLF